MLRDAGASRDVLGCAVEYLCEVCVSRVRVAKPPFSSQLQATPFNEFLGADVSHVKFDVSPCRVLLSACVALPLPKCCVVLRPVNPALVSSTRWNVVG